MGEILDEPDLAALSSREGISCHETRGFVNARPFRDLLERGPSRDLAERGIALAMGSLVSFVERAADLLAPIDGLHWKALLSSPWMATDGTGLKVLVPGLPAAHDGYVELYRNAARAADPAPLRSRDDGLRRRAQAAGRYT